MSTDSTRGSRGSAKLPAESSLLIGSAGKQATRHAPEQPLVMTTPAAIAPPLVRVIPPRNTWIRTLQTTVNDALDQDMFFVIGCQKSGTTWVQHLLHGHPEVCCRGEARFGLALLDTFKEAFARHNQRQIMGDEGALSDTHLGYIFASCIGFIFSQMSREKPGARCLGEKTPEHTGLMPTFASMFPHARFIHVIRDGRDGAVSGWFANRAKNDEPFNQQFPTMARYVEYFVRHHWVPYINVAQVTGRTISDRYLEVRYEDLHANPIKTTQDMLAFLNVDSSIEAARQCADTASFSKLSDGRKRGEEANDSHFRKGIVGDWKNHFDEKSLATFMEHGGPLFRELGYT